jgi:hypothetical protein
MLNFINCQYFNNEQWVVHSITIGNIQLFSYRASLSPGGVQGLEPDGWIDFSTEILQPSDLLRGEDSLLQSIQLQKLLMKGNKGPYVKLTARMNSPDLFLPVFLFVLFVASLVIIKCKQPPCLINYCVEALWSTTS